jgi:Ribbon-helix-helix protein, copG family
MKRGRPKMPVADRRDARVTVRLDAAELATLDALQRELALTESEVLRHALRAFVLPGVTS